MNPNAQKDLLLSTDYPTDKIIRYIEGSYTTNGVEWDNVVNIPFHEANYLIGAILTWSYTSDFSNTYSEGDIQGDIWCKADCGGLVDSGNNISNNTITLWVWPRTGLPPTTIYYRIIVYQFQDGKLRMSASEADHNDFIFNTDYNYTKIYREGLLPTPNPGQLYTVPHNLGYIPAIIGWGVAYETGYNYISSLMSPIFYPTSSFSPDGYTQNAISVDSSSLYILSPGIHMQTDFVYYRIYVDEQQ